MTDYSNTYAVLLNSPAGLGKTKALEYLKARGYNLAYRSCKDHLHKLTQLFFNVPEERYWEIYNNRKLKESFLPEFSIITSSGDKKKLKEVLPDFDFWADDRNWELGSMGTIEGLRLTIREALIYVSEVICKPRFGSDYFGKARALSVQPNEIIIDDSTAAFEVGGEVCCDEVVPLIEKIGQDNILLLRLHREGFDFTGDSRRYVKNGVCKNTIDILNNSELEFYQEVTRHVHKFLIERGAL